jgi:hypothetical protein
MWREGSGLHCDCVSVLKNSKKWGEVGAAEDPEREEGGGSTWLLQVRVSRCPGGAPGVQMVTFEGINETRTVFEELCGGRRDE